MRSCFGVVFWDRVLELCFGAVFWGCVLEVVFWKLCFGGCVFGSCFFLMGGKGRGGREGGEGGEEGRVVCVWGVRRGGG